MAFSPCGPFFRVTSLKMRYFSAGFVNSQEALRCPVGPGRKQAHPRECAHEYCKRLQNLKLAPGVILSEAKKRAFSIGHSLHFVQDDGKRGFAILLVRRLRLI